MQSERYSDIYFVPFSSSFFSAKRVPSIATLLPGSNSAGELGFSEKRHINVVESKSASSESGSKSSSSESSDSVSSLEFLLVLINKNEG